MSFFLLSSFFRLHFVFISLYSVADEFDADAKRRSRSREMKRLMELFQFFPVSSLRILGVSLGLSSPFQDRGCHFSGRHTLSIFRRIPRRISRVISVFYYGSISKGNCRAKATERKTSETLSRISRPIRNLVTQIMLHEHGIFHSQRESSLRNFRTLTETSDSVWNFKSVPLSFGNFLLALFSKHHGESALIFLKNSTTRKVFAFLRFFFFFSFSSLLRPASDSKLFPFRERRKRKESRVLVHRVEKLVYPSLVGGSSKGNNQFIQEIFRLRSFSNQYNPRWPGNFLITTSQCFARIIFFTAKFLNYLSENSLSASCFVVTMEYSWKNESRVSY